jgi:predicted DNA-binding transcriptional regulator YafY
MSSYHLLASIQPGWLDEYIEPLKDKIQHLLHNASQDFEQLQRRVRVLQTAARPTNLDDFKKVSDALLSRRRLYVIYHGRARDKNTEREISPQRLVYYRSNWYLDAWCHQVDELRTFSLDRLHPAQLLDDAAIDVNETALNEHYASSYGIFAGSPGKIAKLRFSAEAAKWVADEQWHPTEEGRVMKDGRYELKIPYSDTRELLMDILKYGPEVEVLGPVSLRKEVALRVKRMNAIYTQEE